MKRRNISLLTRIWATSVLSFLVFHANAQEFPAAAMYAHFIDVGQADATLLEFPKGAVLIDAGAQDKIYRIQLVKYLQAFFERRADLHNTLDLVLVTHCHLDHNFALDTIAQTFHIRNYVDNGVQNGSGKRNQRLLEKKAASLGIHYKAYTYEDIIVAGSCDGLSDSLISPVRSGAVAPQIALLSGRFAHPPADWSKGSFNNGNNHSLVIKVTFGKSTFLFTGDLETAGINTLLKTYSNCRTLDVDILRVGHHGADNATTPAYLQAVTPLTAIISCGRWNYGIGPPPHILTTYAYGHPRWGTLDALEKVIPGTRAMPVNIHAGTAGFKYIDYKVSHEIYATAWDHNILLQATSDGYYKMSHKAAF